MENAADALKMAAAVLIFVMALSISINAFGEVRKTSRIILEYKDREYDYTYVDENKDDAGKVSTERWVGIETIIPSIYKAYKENYKVVFTNIVLYKKMNSPENGGLTQEIKYIDLQETNLGIASDEQKRIFIVAILYGENGYNMNQDKSLYGGKTWDEIKIEFRKLNIDFCNDKGLIGQIKDKKYRELLGEYYQDEIEASDQTSVEDIPDANRKKKRIITYSDT